jgi:hypothetical protein
MLEISNQLYRILKTRTLFLFFNFFIFCIYCSLNDAVAEEYVYAQQIKLNTLKTLIAKVDANRVNRISIIDKQITEVIGDTEEFSYEIDGKGNVFVSPSVIAGESFEVTINLDNGKTQSLRFNVGDIGYGQTIILNDEELSFSNTSMQDRIIEIIKAVQLKELDLIEKSRLKSDFIIGVPEGGSKIFDIARIKEVKVLGDIKGFVLEISGPEESFADFKERDLKWKKGKILAVTLNRGSIGSNLEAIIIARRGE